MGIVAGVLYWTILQVAIPGTPGISWIGHLGGLFGGVLAAWFLRTRTPAEITSGGGGWRSGWTTGIRSGADDGRGAGNGSPASRRRH